MTKDGIYIQEIRAFQIEPLAAVDATVEEWLREVRDPWVVGEASKLMAGRTLEHRSRGRTGRSPCRTTKRRGSERRRGPSPTR